jgi:hypothetical protein
MDVTPPEKPGHEQSPQERPELERPRLDLRAMMARMIDEGYTPVDLHDEVADAA